MPIRHGHTPVFLAMLCVFADHHAQRRQATLSGPRMSSKYQRLPVISEEAYHCD